MTGLFWNILLATFWVFLTASFEAANYFFGFFIGYIVISVIHRRIPSLNGYPRRLPRFISFIGVFIKELVVSNIRVAIDIVTPTWYMKPGVLCFELSSKTDIEITLVSNFISLTPGTLVLDVSEDKKTLFVHAMFLAEENKTIADLKEIERRLLELMR